MKLDYCFHTHTSRCNHAFGNDEDYVKKAIKAGIKVLGFSDHAMFPGLIQERVRGNFSIIDDYVNSVNYLRKKYKDKITILLGFEAEFFPKYIDFYKELFSKYHFDYLILGQHFLPTFDDQYIGVYTPKSVEHINEYLDLVEQAAKTGYFTYIAHPDICLGMFTEFNKEAEEVCHKLCKICEQYNLLLEINLHGMKFSKRNHLMYPNEEFFKIVSKYNLQICFGIDAHDPVEFEDNSYLEALEMAHKYNLNLVGKDFLLTKILKKI